MACLLDIDIPKKPSDSSIVRRLFLDPTASHLIISTTSGENYYLHTQSRQPKPLSRLKNVTIDAVAWNPSQPTASTREILIGSPDGNVYETYIESSTEFYRREEKYLKLIHKTEGPVTGLWIEEVPDRSDYRRVLIAANGRLLFFVGRIGAGHGGSSSIFTKLFDSENPAVRTAGGANSQSGVLVVTPEVPGSVADNAKSERIFGWQSGQGLVHGKLWALPSTPETGGMIFADSMTLPVVPATTQRLSNPRSKNVVNHGPFVALTQWHILQIIDNRIIANNRLDHSVIHDQVVLDSSQHAIALLADLKQNTFWLFTTNAIYEISATDEDRDVWKILLAAQKYDLAAQYANNPQQRDLVAAASGDALLKRGMYIEAAETYGASSKPFEQVALSFIDAGHREALRKYLLAKLFSTTRKPSAMQRTMLASWLTELYMTALNTLDDSISTSITNPPTSIQPDLSALRAEYADFIRRAKGDLDRTTTYTLIASHGREEELITYATAISDYNYIVSYWVQRERWPAALAALMRQPDAVVVYKYSAVLLCNAPEAFTDILMRTPDLDTRKLIPALLAYTTAHATVPLKDNQAVRYLLYDINTHASAPAAVHNTLISIYAAHNTQDESALLSYLDSQTPSTILSTSAAASQPDSITAQLPYDADFALRLCVQHRRIRSAVHIHVTMEQPGAAVELALRHGEHQLAISVAERPEIPLPMRKSLWLAIARAVISPSADLSTTKAGSAATTTKSSSAPAPASIHTALSLLRLAPPGTLRIEDLLPLLPDLVLIDALKPEILAALAAYSAQIDGLRAEMDAAAATAARVAHDGTRAASRRAAVIRPGDACVECGESLLLRRWWVWGCGHGAHEGCVADAVVARGAKGRARRVRELRARLGRDVVPADAGERARVREELDEILGAECPLCGELAVRDVDRPFVAAGEAGAEDEWAM